MRTEVEREKLEAKVTQSHQSTRKRVPPMTTPTTAQESAQTSAGASDAPKRPSSMGELFASLSQQVTTLVNSEIELNKVKAKNFVKKAGSGAVFLGAAAVFALFMLGWLFRCVELAIALSLPAWAASLITAGILCLIAAVLGLIGRAQLKKSKESRPDPKSGFDESIDAFKKGLGK